MEQPKCPSVDEWIKMLLYIDKYYSAIKKSEILPFATTWMDLEGIMLSEIHQAEKDKIPYDFTYMWKIKNTTKQKHL